MAALDVTLRRLGGAPTYVLTDNERSVTVEHVARIPVRNRNIVTFARYYGVTVLTCQVRDPASKGGVENAVKLAKADLVPTETNLRETYASFGDLEAACTNFVTLVNTRVHRATRRVPAEMLTQEVLRLHPVPAAPHTQAFGETRTVAVNTPMVTFQGGSYSVPASLMGKIVWVRVRGAGKDEEVIFVHPGRVGAVEVGPAPPSRTGQPADRPRPLPGPAGGGVAPGTQGQQHLRSRIPCSRRWGGVVVEGGRRAGHLQDPGKNGPRRVAGEADHPRAGRVGARARRGLSTVRRR